MCAQHAAFSDSALVVFMMFFFNGFQFEVGGLLFSDYGYSLSLIRLRLGALLSNEQQLEQKPNQKRADRRVCEKVFDLL
jgi:hypothetical protein